MKAALVALERDPQEEPMTNKQIFDDLITACTTEFLHAAGVEFCSSIETEVVMEYASVIGFSGNDMRGVIGLGMSGPTLGQLAGFRAIPNVDAPMEDWLGEASNQLLGRLKNKLLGYGTIVSIALPMTLRGVRLQFISTRAMGVWTYGFDSKAGQICVWLDVRVKDGFVLTPSNDADMQGVPEGELMLF
jgi:hypothetical protein